MFKLLGELRVLRKKVAAGHCPWIFSAALHRNASKRVGCRVEGIYATLQGALMQQIHFDAPSVIRTVQFASPFIAKKLHECGAYSVVDSIRSMSLESFWQVLQHD